MEIQITLEDFKLIKSFYPEFTRKQIESNDFVIGWSELMPVVGKLTQVARGKQLAWFDTGSHLLNADIDIVYKCVVRTIKWYNANQITNGTPE